MKQPWQQGGIACGSRIRLLSQALLYTGVWDSCGDFSSGQDWAEEDLDTVQYTDIHCRASFGHCFCLQRGYRHSDTWVNPVHCFHSLGAMSLVESDSFTLLPHVLNQNLEFIDKQSDAS